MSLYEPQIEGSFNANSGISRLCWLKTIPIWEEQGEAHEKKEELRMQKEEQEKRHQLLRPSWPNPVFLLIPATSMLLSCAFAGCIPHSVWQDLRPEISGWPYDLTSQEGFGSVFFVAKPCQSHGWNLLHIEHHLQYHTWTHTFCYTHQIRGYNLEYSISQAITFHYNSIRFYPHFISLV